jgi:RNA polymerase sigma factor (sigma-70 family)
VPSASPTSTASSRAAPQLPRLAAPLALHKVVDRQRYHCAAARDPAREQPPGDGTPFEPFADTLHQLPSPSQLAVRRDEAELLERALRELPDEQRQVVTMARLLDMSHAEIGEVLGTSEPACRMLLQRGLARLSAIMVEIEDREADRREG